MAKGPNAFRTISEAAEELGVPQHVLRFWESRFSFIRPMKRAGGRRFYRPQDIAVLAGVRALLHGEGYTIKGVQKLHKDYGVARILAAQDGPQGPPIIDEDDTAPPDEMEVGAEAYELDDDAGDEEADEDFSDDEADESEPLAELIPTVAPDVAPSPARRRRLTAEARLRLNRALDDLTDVQARLEATLRGE